MRVQCNECDQLAAPVAFRSSIAAGLKFDPCAHKREAPPASEARFPPEAGEFFSFLVIFLKKIIVFS